jgi:uncharacterized protein YggE
MKKNNLQSMFFLFSLLQICIVTEVLSETGTSVPVLATTGTGELKVEADQVVISFSVVTEHASSTEAIRENSAKTERVLIALKKLDLSKEEYQTGSFSVWPRYSHSKMSSEEERIIGYQVSNNVVVVSKKIDKAGVILDAANQAGVNRVDSVSFGVSDQRTRRKEAIRIATDNAIQDAKYLAEAAGVSLKRVISVQVDDAYGGGVMPLRGPAITSSKAFSDAAVPLESGFVSIRARVAVTWEIE